MMPEDPASAYDIQTRDLNLWYGNFQALKQVTVNIRQGLITALIQDAGLTEFGGVPTYTALAVGPDRADRVDAITGTLPLL